MPNLPQAASEVFDVLRSYKYDLKLYDDDNQSVTEPNEARRMLSTKNDLLCTLTDNGQDSELSVKISKKDNPNQLMGLIQSLRSVTTKFNLLFNLQRYGRTIEPEDAKPVREGNRGNGTIMNICEGMYGTTRSSYLKLENARMIVRHHGRIDPEKLGSRSRCIESILIENAQGERMMFPTKHLSPARAMSQHVNQGGKFADDVGKKITELAEDYSNLAKCSSYIRTNAGSLKESAMALREDCRAKRLSMRKMFERLQNPNTYTVEAETLTSGDMLNEQKEKSKDCPDCFAEAREMLSVTDVQLDESVVASAARVLEAKHELTARLHEPSIRLNFAPQVSYSVSKSVWERLKNDGEIAVFNHAPCNPSYRASDDPTLRNFEDVIPSIADDSLMNMCSGLVDNYRPEDTPSGMNNTETQRHTRSVATAVMRAAKIVVQKGNKASKEMPQANPMNAAASMQVAEEDCSIPVAKGSKAIRAFETWLQQFDVDTIFEAAEHRDSFTSDDIVDDLMGDAEYAGQRDTRFSHKDHPDLHDDLVDYFELESPGNDPDELADQTEHDVLPTIAKSPFDTDETSEIDEGAILTKSDILLPSGNQGRSLKREVTPQTVTDQQGDEVAPDTGYVNTLMSRPASAVINR